MIASQARKENNEPLDGKFLMARGKCMSFIQR